MIGLCDLDLFVVGVLHEVAHLNLGDKVSKAARDHGFEPDVLTESVANMVTGTIIHRMGLEPPRLGVRGPDTDEYESFMETFEEYNKVVRPLWAQYLKEREEEKTKHTIDQWLAARLATQPQLAP